MHEALERVEAHDACVPSGRSRSHHAAPQIEDDEQREHAEHGDGADPAQRNFVELTPVAAGGLFDVQTSCPEWCRGPEFGSNS